MSQTIKIQERVVETGLRREVMISEQQYIFMPKLHFLFVAREKACDSTKRATVALCEEENYVKVV